MKFFIGLAALTYTLATVGPLGWFLLFLVAATAYLAVLWAGWWLWLLLGVLLTVAPLVAGYLIARFLLDLQARRR